MRQKHVKIFEILSTHNDYSQRNRLLTWFFSVLISIDRYDKCFYFFFFFRIRFHTKKKLTTLNYGDTNPNTNSKLKHKYDKFRRLFCIDMTNNKSSLQWTVNEFKVRVGTRQWRDRAVDATGRRCKHISHSYTLA